MTHPSPAHPHAIRGVLHAPAGMPLPATGVVEATRGDGGLRGVLDVIGGVAFAVLVAGVCMRMGSSLLAGYDAGWIKLIAWESVWLLAAMLCAPLLPNGIHHDISVRSTIDGLRLHWPELAYTLWVIGLYTAYLGEFTITPGPLAFALAVGTAEEMIFRVLLLGWLVTRATVPVALAVSSIVFGLAHLQEPTLAGVLRCVPQTAGGFVLGAVYLRTRNPLGPILAHAFWDLPYFVAMEYGVSGGGGAPGATTPAISELVPWIAFCIYGLWLVRGGVPMVGRVAAIGGGSARDGRIHGHGQGHAYEPM